MPTAASDGARGAEDEQERGDRGGSRERQEHAPARPQRARLALRDALLLGRGAELEAEHAAGVLAHGRDEAILGARERDGGRPRAQDPHRSIEEREEREHHHRARAPWRARGVAAVGHEVSLPRLHAEEDGGNDDGMLIADKKVVHIDYTLRTDDGEVVDTSEGGEPLAYLHG